MAYEDTVLTALQASLPNVMSVSFVAKPNATNSIVVRPEGTIIVGWSAAPSNQNQQQAESIVSGLAPSVSDVETLDGVVLHPKAKAAIIVRLSTQWGNLNAQQQQRIQNIIDAETRMLVKQLS